MSFPIFSTVAERETARPLRVTSPCLAPYGRDAR